MNALLGSKTRVAVVVSRSGAAALLVAAAALVSLSCGDGTSGPPYGAGDLVVHLISPNGAEGAAVLETSDEGITGVACDSCDVYHNRAVGMSRIVVLMDRSGEISFRMSVRDRRLPPELQVVEVAGPSNEARDDVSQYTVRYSW
jgi:hypothetical protein